jgi:type IV pilus assembly protein PilY1
MGTTVSSCPAVTGPAVTDSYTADISSDLQRQDTPSAALATGKKGWYVNMAAASGNSGAERIVSDVSATFNGTVFYTSYTPTSDPCSSGGNTSMWAVKYDTGGTPSADSLKGKAPVQTSSGGITMIDLATAFTQNSGRKLSSSLSPAGMTPKGKFPPLLQPKAIKQILNIQEQ